MAQIVILCPKGEDVEAGKKALQDAGHDVEVIDADPVHLLHLALGMMEDEEAPAEAPTEELPAEEEEEAPVEEPEVPKNESIVRWAEAVLADDSSRPVIKVAVCEGLKRNVVVAPRAATGFVQVSEDLAVRPAASGAVSLSLTVNDKTWHVSAASVTGKDRTLYVTEETARHIL